MTPLSFRFNLKLLVYCQALAQLITFRWKALNLGILMRSWEMTTFPPPLILSHSPPSIRLPLHQPHPHPNLRRHHHHPPSSPVGAEKVHFNFVCVCLFGMRVWHGAVWCLGSALALVWLSARWQVRLPCWTGEESQPGCQTWGEEEPGREMLFVGIIKNPGRRK